MRWIFVVHALMSTPASTEGEGGEARAQPSDGELDA